MLVMVVEGESDSDVADNVQGKIIPHCRKTTVRIPYRSYAQSACSHPSAGYTTTCPWSTWKRDLSEKVGQMMPSLWNSIRAERLLSAGTTRIRAVVRVSPKRARISARSVVEAPEEAVRRAVINESRPRSNPRGAAISTDTLDGDTLPPLVTSSISAREMLRRRTSYAL